MVKNEDKCALIDEEGCPKHYAKQTKIGNSNSSTITAHGHRDRNSNVALQIDSMLKVD